MDREPDELWRTLFSGNAGQIRRIWMDLSDDEARAITTHLKQMIDDEGYSEEQKEAARQALQVIRDAV